MGFLAGVVAEINRQEDAATRADEFMMSQLDKLKGVIIPELMEKIKTRTENAAETKDRIDFAQSLGLSEKSAYALEVTGQLEFELLTLQQLDKNDKVAKNFIKTLDATITSQIDNDEDIAKGISAGIAAMKKNMTAQDSMNALMKAMSATTRDEFEDAMEGVTVKTITMPEVEDFEYRPTGGRAMIESSELNRMDQRIAQSLQTTFGEGYEVKSNRDGLSYISFVDDDLNKLFTKLAEEARLRATSAELGVGGSPAEVSLYIGQALQNARRKDPTTQDVVVSNPLSIFNNLDKILANPGGFDWSSLPTTTSPSTSEDDDLDD